MELERQRFEQEAYTADEYDQMRSSETNGEARIPICFCIDTSDSMRNIIAGDWIEVGEKRFVDGQSVVSIRQKPGGKPLVSRLDELKRVLQKLILRLKGNSRTRNSAMISMITFDEYAECIMEFRDVEEVDANRVSHLHSGVEKTSLVRGIKMALERIESSNFINGSFGNHTYRPILVILSDGTPTDSSKSLNEMRGVVRKMTENNELYVMPIGIGSNFNAENLRMFSGESKVYTMQKEEDFNSIFDHIENTISWVTKGMVNEVYDYEKAEVYVEEGVVNTDIGVNVVRTLDEFIYIDE